MTSDEAKERKRAYDRAYHQEHSDRIRARKRAHRQAHPEIYRARSRAYIQAHTEEWRALALAYYHAHKEDRAQYVQQYRKTDRGKEVRRRLSAQRRALLAGLPATLTEADWEASLQFFGNRCAYCGDAAVPLHQEHVVPLSVGGGYEADNIVPACARCNRSKRDSPLEAWAVSHAFVLPDAIRTVEAYLESYA